MRAAALAACLLAAPARAQGPAFDWPALRRGWRESIARVKASGRIPLIDLLSTYRELSMNPEEYQKEMDRLGIAVTAFSPDAFEGRHFALGTIEPDWGGALRRLSAAGPARFIPVPASGLDVAVLTQSDPEGFLGRLLARAAGGGYPLAGEFRFKASPTDVQAEAIAPPFDWPSYTADIPIDGPLGRELFAFSQEHGLPFLLHYEAEDSLLGPLEKMLDRYPGAVVVWRSLGRGKHEPDHVRGLLERHPNLYVDLSGTGERTSALWDRRYGVLDPAWAALIRDQPWRFVSALGLDHDHIIDVGREAQAQRALLLELPPSAREIVAYKAAWKLLFREELP